MGISPSVGRQWRSFKRLRIELLEPRLAMTGVAINELLASNVDGITDQDGAHSDWIELINHSTAPIDLAGWHLTDDAGNLAQWTFPTTVLDPGQVLVVFASDKNRATSGQELHTNFKLATAGDYLALVMPDGVTIVDSFSPFPEQHNDISYGLGVSDGASVGEALVGASTTVKAISPTAASVVVDDNWREIGFNDGGWLTGSGGVGFDRNSDGVALAPFIGRTLATGEMDSSDATPQYSAYVRYAFNVTDKEQLTGLQLDLRFDDGFIAYLNGREVRRVNFAEDFVYTQPQWNSYAGNQTTGSTAGAANRVGEADDMVTFDLTPYLGELVNGPNVLAFHAVNSNSTSGANTNRLDFLVQPVLTATRAVGAAQIGYLAAPTPGRANGFSVQGIVSDTHFSIDRGFYSTTQSVEITSTTPGAIIRYTTDGSEPTLTHGATYAGPLAISTTTVLRARGFKAGFKPTNVDTVTYMFLDSVLQQDATYAQPSATWGHDKDDADTASGYNLDEDERDWDMDPQIVDGHEAAVKSALTAIPTMSIVMDWDDLFGGTPQPGTFAGSGTVAPNPQGIYIMGRSDERAMSLEYLNPNLAADTFHLDGAIEIQGHSSPTRWNADKLSFQVKFKERYGPTSLNYQFFTGTPDGQNATSRFDTLILDAMFNYSWVHGNAAQRNYARFVTDQVTADLQNLASGGGQAPHGKYVHLYLNGLYWGLYNVHERPDDSFAEQYYGGEKEDYYVVKHANQDIDHEYTWVEGGGAAEQAYAVLLNAARAVETNPANAATYQVVQSLLDVDQFIDYMLVHYYIGDKADWAHNNWYATFNHVDPAGRWRFHAWDQEHAFPTADNGDAYSETTDLTLKDDLEAPTEIHQNLIKNEEYRLRFADRVQALMYNGGALTDATAKAVYQSRVNEILEAVIGESARWGDNRVSNDPYTQTDFETVTDGVLANFFGEPGGDEGRTQTVLGHFEGASTDEPTNANDWLPSLAAPTMNQYGGAIAAGFDLTLAPPIGSPGGAVIYYTTDGSDPRLAGGGLSPTAMLYGTALDLTSSTRVIARVFLDAAGTANDWSPRVDKTFVVPESFPVRIVELNYHPASHSGIADAEDLEFVELLNTGDSAVSLDGVQITAFATAPYHFADGLMLGAGQRLVVAKNPTAFAQVYGSAITLAPDGYGTANLSNGGERIVLLGPAGETLQDFTYDDVAPWPTSADGGGRSLEIIDPLGDARDPINWRASAQVDGSPGADGLPAVPGGNFDGDDDVDGNDFLAWQRGFGISASRAMIGDGDADGDHDVDGADLGAWTDHFGEQAAGAAALVIDGASVAGVITPADVAVLVAPVRRMYGEAASERERDVVFASWPSAIRRRDVVVPERAGTAGASDRSRWRRPAAIDEFFGDAWRDLVESAATIGGGSIERI